MKKALLFVLFFILYILFISPVNAATTFQIGRVKYNLEDINIRSGPGTNYSKVTDKFGILVKLDYPDSFDIVSKTGNWYKIAVVYQGYDITGYAYADYIDVKSYTTDDAYKLSLKSKGFPDSYLEGLTRLHAVHPNWTFTLSKTGDLAKGLDFNYAVTQETNPVDRSLIRGNDVSLRSTAEGAYLGNNQWVIFSGYSYAASARAVAYFMDPRNFFNETFMFQFENLSYDANTQTKEVVQNIIAGTYLDGTFTCTSSSNGCKAGTYKYVDVLMEVGKLKGVSPVHLATRIIQEQGTQGSTLSLGKGYNGKFVGYYNFFNIYANGSTPADVITNGLQHAKNKNWNNPYISILDGADLLAYGYIRVGQNTLYYQRFDVVGSYNLFQHQYMQNIKAAWSEAYSTYAGYRRIFDKNKANWDQSKYNFIVPIFNNMPSTTSLSTKLNDDSTLSTLSVSGCNINPAYTPSAYNYTCEVESTTTSVTVTAKATNTKSSVSGTGTVNLSANSTTREVVVTAENGTKTTYKIVITKKTNTNNQTDTTKPDQIVKNTGYIVDGNYMSGISYKTDISTIINKIKNKYPSATVTGSKSSGIVATGNTITIKNNNVSSTFKVVIRGDVSGDGVINALDVLKVQKHVLGVTKLTDDKLKAADVSKDGSVNALDVLRTQKQVLGLYTIVQ